MAHSSFSAALVMIGAALIVVGVIGWFGWLSWLGHLPGDIRIERPGLRIYVPITSSLLVSLLLSLLLALLRRFR